LGPNWEGAVLPLQIVALALPLRLLSVLLSSVVQGMGHAGLDLRNSISGVILLPCCFVVGALYGSTGLALAWLVGLPLLVALNLHRSAAVLGIGIVDALRALSRPAGLSAVMAAAVTAIGHWSSAAGLPVWPSIALMIAVAAPVYLGLLWLLDRASVMQLLKLVRSAPAD
jgi:O-antigen/teichoic acid export membrane protein